MFNLAGHVEFLLGGGGWGGEVLHNSNYQNELKYKKTF